MKAALLALILLAGAACSPRSGRAPDTDTRAISADLAADLAATVHPQISTVLVATWTQDRATARSWVEYAFEDTVLTTPVIARQAGPSSEPLLGIPPDTAVTVRVVNQDDGQVESEEVTSTTGALPADLAVPSVASFDPALASPERYMLISENVGAIWYGGPFYLLILDRQGRVVWYWEVPDDRCTLYAQPSRDGTHLFVDGNGTFVFNPRPIPAYYRLTLDLSRAEETELPDLVFSIDEADDGRVYFGRQENNQATLAVHTEDGAVTDVWNCTDYLDNGDSVGEPCSANTVVWDPDRDTVLYSMPQNDTVIEVDAATGDVLKQLGGTSGGYTIDPETSRPDFQHYANWTPDGTILLSTHVPDATGEMRAREYTVDTATQTLTELWSYGAGGTHYADLSGEATRLDNGNTLIGYGTDGAVLEVTHDGGVAWDVEWPRVGEGSGGGGILERSGDTNLVGHATLIDDLYALNGETADP